MYLPALPGLWNKRKKCMYTYIAEEPSGQLVNICKISREVSETYEASHVISHDCD